MKVHRYNPGDQDHKAWFGEGLRFACTGCGACCKGGSGRVWVDIADIKKLASHFGVSLDDFGRRFLTRIGRRYALLDKPTGGDCVFLRGNACSVYENRPAQCSAYPWWPEIIGSPAAWSHEATRCEGISRDAATVASADIVAALSTLPAHR